MKLYIDHDYTSTYMLTSRPGGPSIELTEAEHAEYNATLKAFCAWQARLDAVYMAEHQAFLRAKQQRAAEVQAMRDLNTRSNM